MKDEAGEFVRLPTDIKTLLDSERWEPNENFEEVPARLLKSDRWQHVLSDRWLLPGDILLLEARVLVKAAERVANSVPMSSVRVLLLGDNMSVVLAFGRCRAREYKL